LIVGTSYSAEDIASQCWKYGAKSIRISHRTKPIGYKTWPENITEVPLLQKVVSDPNPKQRGCLPEQGGVAHYRDGSTSHVEAIILCTGYMHDFHFLSEELRLNPHDCKDQPVNKIWLKGLYHGLFTISNPKLMHIGPHTGFFTWGLFDAQAFLARDFMMGTFKLPDAQAIAEHDRMMCQKAHALEKADSDHYDHECINFQGNYFKELISMTDHPEHNVDGVKDLFCQWEEHKKQGIMTFRNNTYRSVVTGEMSPVLVDRDGNPMEWKDAVAVETCESFGMYDLFDGNERKSTPIKKSKIDHSSAGSPCFRRPAAPCEESGSAP